MSITSQATIGLFMKRPSLQNNVLFWGPFEVDPFFDDAISSRLWSWELSLSFIGSLLVFLIFQQLGRLLCLRYLQ